MKFRALALSILSLFFVVGCAARPATSRVVVRPARVVRPAAVRVAVVRPPPGPVVVSRPGRAFVWR